MDQNNPKQNNQKVLNPLLLHKLEVLRWLEQTEARHFLDYLELVQEYNNQTLRIADEPQKIHRAQGALEIVETILRIKEMLTDSIKREQEDLKKRPNEPVNTNVQIKNAQIRPVHSY